jgi:RelA/SpoT family protein
MPFEGPINVLRNKVYNELVRLGLVPPAILAHRLKRASSILAKLRRMPKLKLSRMQDIGGLRAVVLTLENARALQEACGGFVALRDDYISQPKPTGYRGVHLIFRHDELQVEFQVRTALQHAWATAVETMEILLGKPLKAGQGPDKWLKFFEITASAFAHVEDSPLVPGYEGLSKAETFQAVAAAKEQLNLLLGFVHAANVLLPTEQGVYSLITLNRSTRLLAAGRTASRGSASLAAGAIGGDHLPAIGPGWTPPR